MAKYTVGDKVRIVDKWGDGCRQNYFGKMDKWLGKVMTIRVIESDGCYRMKEDQGENGHGWWWNDACIAGYANDEITITRYGDKVVAKYGKKVGVAKCSPDDTFDFAVGAKLAFKRLMGEPEDKPEPKRKFKLGEFVKVIDKTNPLHNFPLGSIVAIMDLKDDKAVCYGLATKFGRYSFCRQTLSLNDLEPLSENTHGD